MADSHGRRVRPASYAGADRLRDAFLAAGYTVDGVAELLGPTAQAALGRHETVPARRATADGGPLATLVRLFLLQQEVAQAEVAAVLPLDVAVSLGVVGADGDDVRARVDVRPYGEDREDGAADDDRWWVVSTSGPASTASTGRSTASTCSASAGRPRRSRSSRRVTPSAAPSTSAPAAACRPCTRAGTAAPSSAPTCRVGRCSSRA